jgi:hypothetical protein
MSEFNIRLLKKLDVLANESLTLDYDNTFDFLFLSVTFYYFRKNIFWVDILRNEQ